ncbi:HdeD family acid-resistance protein [Microvirga sp. TS319]|uniref:HdeD family acid-resistance protein n=1 Tax=Microvirga sp. TS319 TaxID=3241165 RepID=UPI003519FA28
MGRDDAVPDPAAPRLRQPPYWLRGVLSVVMILGGMMILADVAVASSISPPLIGAAAIVVGTFEIVHAAWTRGWGGLAWQMLLGLLYIVLGLVLVGATGSGVMVLSQVFVRSARQGELLLAYSLGLLLLLSGIVRVLWGGSLWQENGWVMLLSGAFGVAAGLIVLAEFPKTGFWVFGLLLGIDFILHGAAWLGSASLWGGRPPHARDVRH